MEEVRLNNRDDRFSWPYLLLLASVTFLAILSELVPSGILPQMSGGLGVSYSSIGLLVSVYAIASAVGTIPLITLTMEVNRKKLLTILLVGFGVSNLVIAFSPYYGLTAAARLAGGIFAGILWPMISAYAMRLSGTKVQGKAIAITMSGTTFGMGLGLPLMTAVGTNLGWRIEFAVLSIVIFVVAFLCFIFLPSVEGEKKTKTNSPFYIIQNRGVIICLVITLLTIMAHYGLYTYISPLVEEIRFPGGIQLASLLFGIGTLVSVVLATKVIDHHLGGLIVFMLGLGIFTMFLFAVFKGTSVISHGAFFLWGVSFGSLVTMFQAAVVRQVQVGKDVATSLQSSTFNFGIVFGSGAGAAILERGNVHSIVVVCLLVLIVPCIVSVTGQKRLFS